MRRYPLQVAFHRYRWGCRVPAHGSSSSTTPFPPRRCWPCRIRSLPFPRPTRYRPASTSRHRGGIGPFRRPGRIGAACSPAAIHDFDGVPSELYDIQYPAAGDPARAHDVAARLSDASFRPVVLPTRGIDQGVWVPLRRMYPQAHMPVVALSVSPTGDAAHHPALGRALAGLRAEGILVVGSGGLVHNVGDRSGSIRSTDAAVGGRLRRVDARKAGRTRDRFPLGWARQAPHARHAHPTNT